MQARVFGLGEVSEALSQLAEMIGTKQAVISRFECGKGNPTVSFVRKVVTMLGMKLEISILEDGIVHDIQVR